jgi:hypothetical protein
VPGGEEQPISAQPPRWYARSCSETETKVTRSPSRRGISRKPPLKSPSKENVIRSSIATVPSTWTKTETSVSGSVKDFACAGPAATSAAASAAVRT